MINLLLTLGVLGCQAGDFAFSLWRLRAFSFEVEQNPLIKASVKRFGLKKGIAIAMLPPLVLAGVLAEFGFTVGLAMLLGAKLKTMVDQLSSKQLHQELLSLRNQHDAASSLPLAASLH